MFRRTVSRSGRRPQKPQPKSSAATGAAATSGRPPPDTPPRPNPRPQPPQPPAPPPTPPTPPTPPPPKPGPGPGPAKSVVVALAPHVSVPQDVTLHEMLRVPPAMTGLAGVFKDHPHLRSEPLLDRKGRAALAILEERVLARGKVVTSNLARFHRIHCGPMAPEQHAGLVQRLHDLPEIDWAHAETPASSPAVNAANNPLNRFQDYLNPAPVGVDARRAWSQDIYGQGIGFVDMEDSWIDGHEDYAARHPALLYGDNAAGIGDDDGSHGAAVLAAAIGIDNMVGGVGVAPGCASVRLSSYYRASDNSRNQVMEAITHAAAAMAPGDVLLIEAQTDLLPVEITPHVRDAIKVVVDSGIVVIEAGGNGAIDLDNWTNSLGQYQLRVGDPNYFDTGALIVGACQSAVPHDRHPMSNYGSRVNCFAWGENVVTGGYGNLCRGPVPQAWYTGTFSGTSSASAIIAGVALLMQAASVKATGNRMDPAALRDALSDPTYGTLPGPTMPNAIGVMPDFGKILP